MFEPSGMLLVEAAAAAEATACTGDPTDSDPAREVAELSVVETADAVAASYTAMVAAESRL